MLPPSDHTATPAGFRRNAWLASIGTGGWVRSESMAAFVGIRSQRPLRPDARVQVPTIGWQLLSCLRRVTQLSPFPLPNQSASLRRLPQVPLPSPHRHGSEGVASRLKNLDLHPASYTWWRKC